MAMKKVFLSGLFLFASAHLFAIEVDFTSSSESSWVKSWKTRFLDKLNRQYSSLKAPREYVRCVEKAEELFLLSKLSRSREQIQACLRLYAQGPFSETFQDLSLRLGVLAAALGSSDPDSCSLLQPLSSDPKFQAQLNQEGQKTIENCEKHPNPSRIHPSKQAHLPVPTRPEFLGENFLYHTLSVEGVRSFEINLGFKPYRKNLKSKKSLVEIFTQAQIEKLLKESLPSSAPKEKEIIALVSEKRIPVREAVRPGKHSIPPGEFLKEMDSEDDGSTLLDSPWFWVGTAIVAGGAGYLVYDLSRPKKKLRTP